MFSALAEFERELIRERTMAGLAAARARGRKGGRKPVLNAEQEALLRKLAADRNNTPAFICATLGISRTSFYRYLAKPAPKAKPAPTARSRPSATAAPRRKPKRASTKRPARR